MALNLDCITWVYTISLLSTFRVYWHTNRQIRRSYRPGAQKFCLRVRKLKIYMTCVRPPLQYDDIVHCDN